MNKPELLAPCGSYQAFLAAIHAGADAIYLAGNKFGARAYADNFDTDTLLSVISLSHLHHVKVYLTVNTLLKEDEIGELYEYMAPLVLAGLDGVIVQDLGVFSFLQRNFPTLELHASTQMTITGIYGAMGLKELGATRIVPARELTLEELIQIRKTVDIELETFIHGAMCYCYSGGCLMSSLIGGRSGNRGRCAGPCRLPYDNNIYKLSLKDMNTIQIIPLLIEAGIHSFKIEGRMKRPAYVAGTVYVYRKYIDYYFSLLEKYNGNHSLAQKEYTVSKEDMDLLATLYIRTKVGEGYYRQRKGKDMLTPKDPSYAETPASIIDSLEAKYVKEIPKIPVCFTVICSPGKPLRGTASVSQCKVSIEGPIVEQSQKRSATPEDIEKQMKKTGETPFACTSCKVQIEGNVFLPVSVLKNLRRDLLKQIEKELVYGTEF